MENSPQDCTSAQPSHCQIIDNTTIPCFNFFKKVLELMVGQTVASNVDPC
jgi:hypothetical protein